MDTKGKVREKADILVCEFFYLCTFIKSFFWELYQYEIDQKNKQLPQY